MPETGNEFGQEITPPQTFRQQYREDIERAIADRPDLSRPDAAASYVERQVMGMVEALGLDSLEQYARDAAKAAKETEIALLESSPLLQLDDLLVKADPDKKNSYVTTNAREAVRKLEQTIKDVVRNQTHLADRRGEVISEDEAIRRGLEAHKADPEGRGYFPAVLLRGNIYTLASIAGAVCSEDLIDKALAENPNLTRGQQGKPVFGAEAKLPDIIGEIPEISRQDVGIEGHGTHIVASFGIALSPEAVLKIAKAPNLPPLRRR